MKKLLLALMVIMLMCITGTFAQDWADYIASEREDTVVVKDYTDMDNTPSTLNQAIALDDPPDGRVYELKNSGYYPLSNNITTPDRAVTIAGADYTRLTQKTSGLPPLICGSGQNSGGIGWTNDITVKNCMVNPVSAELALGWAFFGSAAAGKTVTLNNCMMEHTLWVMIQSNAHEGTKVHLDDCYFVNMSGYTCRRNGGVFDNVENNTAEMIVNNCTHVMGQGMVYKFRNFPIGKARFNHCTFINMAGQVFETQGYQSDWAVVNSIFINCNVQPYMTGLDADETDPDFLPMGIINVDTLTPEAPTTRKILVDRNLVYWDASLSDVLSQVVEAEVNGTDDWYDQMITMNTRTQAMFNDNTNYPYLQEGTWIEDVLPNFTDPRNLFDDQLDSLEQYAVGTVDTLSSFIMAPWRLVFIDTETDLHYSDFPLPVDLSYDDAALLTGAYSTVGGLPLGDLNWFPTQKATWEAQKAAESAAIDAAVAAGDALPTGISEGITTHQPEDFNLAQNYPNPFNPDTKISFTIRKAGKVSLKVYNTLGQEVATLVNGFKHADTYNITFDGSKLSSGVYFYQLNYDNTIVTKKMMLIK
jgi:hypothetical protein